MTRRWTYTILAAAFVGLLAAPADADELRITASQANVHLYADPNSLVIEAVTAGTILQIHATNGPWYAVILPGPNGLPRIGYVATSHTEVFVVEGESLQRQPSYVSYENHLKLLAILARPPI